MQYSNLPKDEQKRFMADVKAYSQRGMLLIKRLMTAQEMALFRRGMGFIETYGIETEWLESVRTSGDFLNNITKLKGIITSMVNGTQQPAVDLTTTHRGRPTKAEQAARAAQKAEQQQQNEATGLFSQQSGATAPSSVQGGTASSASATASTPSSVLSSDMSLDPAAALQAAALSGTQLHLDQLAFLLSPDLAKQVTNGNIRTMRRQFEDAYAQAKTLAQAGKETEASEQAQLAHDLNAQIEGIYEAVDQELAACYLRLKEDDPYIAEITAKVNDLKEVIAICRPYHKKVSEAAPTFDAKIRAQIKENAPEAVAAREAAKATHDKAAAIIKYLRRTDKPNTDKRLATMRKKLDELHDLIGSEADAYEPLLEAAKADNAQTKNKD